MITLFDDLKAKYKSIDLVASDENSLIIGDFMFRRDGSISISRSGFSITDDKYFSVYVEINKQRTPEQMDMFIQAIL